MPYRDLTLKHVCFATALLCAMAAVYPLNLFADPQGFGGVAEGAATANEIAKFKGTLKGFQRSVLLVNRDDGKEVMVQLPADLSAFTFLADAKLPFLQRGMMVRYSGTFSPNGMLISPIEKVEIFQPINMKGLPGHSKEKFTPGVHPVDRHAPKQQVGIAKYTIVGTLMGINNAGVMMVQAGKVPVNAQLADTATFQVRFNNLNLAKEGDPVSVSGFYTPPDDTKIRADSITITTDRVYGEFTEKVPLRRTRKSRLEKEAAKKEAAGEAKPASETAPKGDSAEPSAEVKAEAGNADE